MNKILARLFAEAKAGSVNAESLIGFAYFHGQELEKSGAKAFPHLKRAADAGHKHSAELLGRLYITGDGVAQDFTQAFHYYSLADSYAAALELAGMHALGQGVPRDLEKAMKLATAAFQAIPEAAPVIALIKEQQAREEPQFITDELILDAEKGHPKSGWLVGTSYLTGTKGLARDDKKGARFIQIAADAGEIRAAWLLSFLIKDGRGLPKDIDRGHAMYVGILNKRLYPSVYGEVLDFWKALPPL
jgi:TPR repeat protein